MVAGIASVPSREGGMACLSVCLDFLTTRIYIICRWCTVLPALRRGRLFRVPSVYPDPPWRMRCHFKESGIQRVALQLRVDLCWSLTTAFARLCCMEYIYLTFLWIDNPMAAHRNKCVLHVEKWHLDELQEFWCFFKFDPLSLHWPPDPLGSTHPGLMRRNGCPEGDIWSGLWDGLSL